MGLLNISDVKPGMITNKPVYTPQGFLLLKEGITLNERHIRIFKSWGVLQIDIIGVKKEDIEDIEKKKLTKQEIEDIENKLNKKFSTWKTNDEFSKEIIRITKKIMIEEISIHK